MMTLKVIKEGGLSYIGEANTPHDVYKAMKFIETADREEFYVLHLDAKNNIQSAELVSMGTLNRGLIHPREVYKGAILNNSASIILVHNHPSGEPKPSEEDIAITHRLMAAGDIIGIKILDHVIIGDGEWVGLISEGGLRKEIKEPIVLDSQKKCKVKIRDKKTREYLERIINDNDGERIEELLSDRIINIESVAELIDQLNDGSRTLEIKGDAFRAVEIALKSSIKDLKKEIYVLDRTYRLIDVVYKHDSSEGKPYLCKGCGKTYSFDDYKMLEDPWSDHPCNACGSCEFTVTARDGIRTTDI